MVGSLQEQIWTNSGNAPVVGNSQNESNVAYFRKPQLLGCCHRSAGDASDERQRRAERKDAGK